MDDDEDILRQRSEIADARLGVAEELVWFIAFLIAYVANQHLDSVIASLAIFALTYFAVTAPYRSQAKTAEDTYFRVAKLGKYAQRGLRDD
ncbi:MAG: hypothetical protein KGI91_01590 [Burkholderiales bacterium]|nr:hypothetical protein [Burkholderiales bacterium]MDE2075753.1 hypothetical protein [Burkholderiales bacterium]MDE2432570.1 hypothetical protein [Burkholderiales bacterium]